MCRKVHFAVSERWTHPSGTVDTMWLELDRLPDRSTSCVVS
ncbi:hypothetical protein [Kibdelosporangium philippinense]